MNITLALGGGAGLGWAHIGVIQALEEQGVTISAIAGTSIGAIVAACYGRGKLEALEEIARSTGVLEMLRYADPHWKRGGILGGKQIERRLTEYLGEPDFADLSIPIAAISADLISGKTVVMKQGPVLPAVRASMSLPGIFPPVERDGMLLVDGGAAVPVPVRAARELAPALPCVAVSLQSDYMSRAQAAGISIGGYNNRKPNSVAVVKASVGLSLANLTRYSLERDPPDLLLPLSVGHIDIQDFTKADELIAIGHDEAQDILQKLNNAT